MNVPCEQYVCVIHIECIQINPVLNISLALTKIKYVDLTYSHDFHYLRPLSKRQNCLVMKLYGGYERKYPTDLNLTFRSIPPGMFNVNFVQSYFGICPNYTL